jgi:hypothetical protein
MTVRATTNHAATENAPKTAAGGLSSGFAPFFYDAARVREGGA